MELHGWRSADRSLIGKLLMNLSDQKFIQIFKSYPLLPLIAIITNLSNSMSLSWPYPKALSNRNCDTEQAAGIPFGTLKRV